LKEGSEAALVPPSYFALPFLCEALYHLCGALVEVEQGREEEKDLALHNTKLLGV
jgi:hypothetical protein